MKSTKNDPARRSCAKSKNKDINVACKRNGIK
jgi:hypothetical protein